MIVVMYMKKNQKLRALSKAIWDRNSTASLSTALAAWLETSNSLIGRNLLRDTWAKICDTSEVPPRSCTNVGNKFGQKTDYLYKALVESRFTVGEGAHMSRNNLALLLRDVQKLMQRDEVGETFNGTYLKLVPLFNEIKAYLRTSLNPDPCLLRLLERALRQGYPPYGCSLTAKRTIRSL